MTDTIHQVENDVRATLESGQDIYERVRDITLKALTERELDIDNIKNVVEAVLKGMSSGIGSGYDSAKDAFQQSAGALDEALEKTAQASRLAIEEAASRVSEFSHRDMDQATDNIKNLEDMFLETIEKVAKGSSDVVFGIAKDFIAHARQNGTAVGKEAQVAFDALNNLRHRGQDVLISSAAATTSNLASIASGLLSGIAASLSPEKQEK